jgi:hypothetical protein
MTLSAKHLTAICRLVTARIGAGGETDPQRAAWQELLEAVEKERAGRPPANDTALPPPGAAAPAPAPEPIELGERGFALDLPLQIEVLRQKPRILYAVPGEKPQAIRGKLATKLFGSAKKARAAVKSWTSLPAGVAVPFAKGEITTDWAPIVLNLAPTMNVLRGMPVFSKQKARKAIGERIAAERVRWPKSAWSGRREKVRHGTSARVSPVGGERRLVRVTRFSSRRPDDVSPDVIGAKLAIDRLVEAGILGDDSDAWCAREGRWKPARTGEGFLRIEVYELLGEAGEPRAAAARTRPKRTA